MVDNSREPPDTLVHTLVPMLSTIQQEINDSIGVCTLCPFHSQLDQDNNEFEGARSIVSGDMAKARIVILHDYPERSQVLGTNTNFAPFEHTPVYKQLQDYLRYLEIDLEEVLWCSAGNCYPYWKSDKGKFIGTYGYNTKNRNTCFPKYAGKAIEVLRLANRLRTIITMGNHAFNTLFAWHNITEAKKIKTTWYYMDIPVFPTYNLLMIQGDKPMYQYQRDVV